MFCVSISTKESVSKHVNSNTDVAFGLKNTAPNSRSQQYSLRQKHTKFGEKKKQISHTKAIFTIAANTRCASALTVPTYQITHNSNTIGTQTHSLSHTRRRFRTHAALKNSVRVRAENVFFCVCMRQNRCSFD